MALMENILNSTDSSNLDKLLQNFEFENKQYVKLIEKENQQIEALSKQINDKKCTITRLSSAVTQLDDDTKRAHKQFTQNRDNCESLRKTTVVLMEHEVALNKRLNSVSMTSEQDRSEREGVLKHYRNIWDDYQSTYKTFPLALKLNEEKAEFSQLNLQIEEARNHADSLKQQIRIAQGDEDVNFKNFNSFVTKIAEMKLETSITIQQIQSNIKEKEVLEKEVDKLKNSITKKNSEELMETDGTVQNSVTESGSQSTMIGMYCNMDDTTNEDIVALNTNNNKENNFIKNADLTDKSLPITDIIPRIEEDTCEQSPRIKPATTTEGACAQATTSKSQQYEESPKPLCSIPPNIQIPQAPILCQKMPSRMQVTDRVIQARERPMSNQNMLQRPPFQPSIYNQPRLLTPIISPQIASRSKPFQAIQRPPSLVLPQRPSQHAPKSQTSSSTNAPRLLQPVKYVGSFLKPTANPQQQQPVNRSPVIQAPVLSRPNTTKDAPPCQNIITSPNMFNKNKASPGKTPKLGEKGSDIPQSPLATGQNKKSTNTTPKTPDSSLTFASGTSKSPFDLNKHKENLKQMWKSPNAMPLKGRSMFSEDSNNDVESRGPSNQFMQPFLQSETDSSASFTISAFSNVSSPETPSGTPFSFGSNVTSPEGEKNYMSLFQDNTNAVQSSSSPAFQFSFSGDDPNNPSSPEQSGFSFNFGSPEPQKASMFSFF